MPPVLNCNNLTPKLSFFFFSPTLQQVIPAGFEPILYLQAPTKKHRMHMKMSHPMKSVTSFPFPWGKAGGNVNLLINTQETHYLSILFLPNTFLGKSKG